MTNGDSTMSTPVVQSDVDAVVTYLCIMRTMWPIALVGMMVAFATGFKNIAMEKTWRDKLTAVLVTCIPSAAFSVLGVLLLPYALAGTNITPELEIGMAGVLGGWGSKVFDLILKKVFGLSIVENNNVE